MAVSALLVLVVVSRPTPVAAQPAHALRFTLGSTILEIGGQARLRFEDDEGFDVRGIGQGGR